MEIRILRVAVTPMRSWLAVPLNHRRRFAHALAAASRWAVVVHVPLPQGSLGNFGAVG